MAVSSLQRDPSWADGLEPGAILTLANDAKGRQVDPAKAPACKVKLALAGAGLLVHDEGCVGAGSPANFDGAYFRRRS